MDKLNENEQAIVIKYMSLAEERAKYHYYQYYNKKLILTLDDFISFAYEGLCYAVSSYDESKCASLKTHIVNCIRNKTKTFVVFENSSLKLPHNSSNSQRRKEIRDIGIHNKKNVSYESIIENKNIDKYCSYVQISDANCFESVEFKLLISSIKDNLTKKERQIFECLFIHKLNHKATAQKLGVHINTITRNKKKILDKIKTYMEQI